MLFKTDFSIIALIGVFLLIGIVKKNAILMVDFALQMDKEGMNPRDAIHQACLLRLRPILMTTFAALFTALPLAIISGNGAELREPLGMAIAGGLIVSQFLTLYTTPVIYLELEKVRQWGRRCWGHRDSKSVQVSNGIKMGSIGNRIMQLYAIATKRKS